MADEESMARDVPVEDVPVLEGQPPLREPLLPVEDCKHPEERVWWVTGTPGLAISLNAYDARCLDCGEIALYRPSES